MEPRVIVASDDAICRSMLQRQLQRWGFAVTAVREGAHAWATLDETQSPQLAILDWSSPASDGVELLKRLRTLKASDSGTHLILLTSRDHQDELVGALRAGADDYLVKPFDPFELDARIAVGMRALAAKQDLLQAQDRLRREATFDERTGLWSRNAIVEILKRDIHNRERLPGQLVAVARLGVDGVKHVNEDRRREAVEQTLSHVARRLQRCVRAGDAIGRYGAEEFLLVLPDTEPEAALELAERLRSSVAEPRIAFADGTGEVTVSAGVAAMAGASAAGWREVISAADTALYRARRQGGNRVIIEGLAVDATSRSMRIGTATVGGPRFGGLTLAS
jgi:two-component system, cell cycle response regulator